MFKLCRNNLADDKWTRTILLEGEAGDADFYLPRSRHARCRHKVGQLEATITIIGSWRETCRYPSFPCRKSLRNDGGYHYYHQWIPTRHHATSTPSYRWAASPSWTCILWFRRISDCHPAWAQMWLLLSNAQSVWEGEDLPHQEHSCHHSWLF